MRRAVLSLFCLAACSDGGDRFTPSANLSITHTHIFGTWGGSSNGQTDPQPAGFRFTSLTVNETSEAVAGGAFWITGLIATGGSTGTTSITAGGDRVLVEASNGTPRFAKADLRYSRDTQGREVLNGTWIVTSDAEGLHRVDDGTMRLYRQPGDAPSLTIEHYEGPGWLIQIRTVKDVPAATFR